MLITGPQRYTSSTIISSERTTGYDQELLAMYQTEFFTDAVLLGTSQKHKKKRINKVQCPWAVTGQRHAAHAHIVALDGTFRFCIGIGLIYFHCQESIEDAVRIILESGKFEPTLILHAGEGSPAYSMIWYLLVHRDLRFMPVRDIYH